MKFLGEKLLLAALILTISVSTSNAQEESGSTPPPAFTPGSIEIIPNPQPTSSEPTPTTTRPEVIEATTSTSGPTPTDPITPEISPKPESVPVSAETTPDALPATKTPPIEPSQENTTDTNTVILFSVLSALGISAVGVSAYQMKKKYRKSSPCDPIKTILDQAKGQLQNLEATFSAKQAALDLLSQKIEDIKGRAESTIKNKIISETKSHIFDIKNTRTLKLQILDLEDTIAHAIKNLLGKNNFTFDPSRAEESGFHLFTIPHTAVRVFLRNDSDREKIDAAFKENAAYQEIKNLQETLERSLLVENIEHAKGSYEDIQEKWESLKNELSKLEDLKNTWRDKIKKLEASYHTCTLTGILPNISLKLPNSIPQRVLILGPSGSGKTYISKTLQEKGVESALDAHTIDGLGSSSWDKDRLSKLIKDNLELYLFGHAENIWGTIPLFDKVFFLKTHPEVLKNRVSPEKYEKILEITEEAEERARRRGIPMIDSTKPPENILSEISKTTDK